MIIDCISDLHGHMPRLQGGDLLLVCGDLTGHDMRSQFKIFSQWLHKQDYKKKVVVAGNHDGLLAGVKPSDWPFKMVLEDGSDYPFADYLCDSGTSYEGLNIWGSPYTPEFFNWHFMEPRGEPMMKHWDLIPTDTDILVTHGPPYGILDKVNLSIRGNPDGHAGCEMLWNSLERIKPKLHAFGHIHEAYGIDMMEWDAENKTEFVNCAIMDRKYNPINSPVRITL